MRQLTILLALLLLAACDMPTPQERQETLRKGANEVPPLFVGQTPDGTKVWKLWDKDGNRSVYVATPAGNVSWRVDTQTMCGKAACTRSEYFQTVTP